MSTYRDFLEAKIRIERGSGFQVDQSEINPRLKPHQRDITQWALAGGRRGVFAAFGLGKTYIQLEILSLIMQHEGGRQLIICPLGVRHEFFQAADELGIKAAFVRRSEDVSGGGMYVTNYESVRDGRLDVNLFNAVSLDEASVLRSFGSKTYQTFLSLFSGVKYRFVATATPSPNRLKELIHYAGFLGVMDTGQALTRFFKRDSTKANNLTLYPHKEREFWLWVNSWAIFLQKPSDLGYSDEGYELPTLHVHYHQVESGGGSAMNKDGQLLLVPDAALSLQAASKEKRDSLDNRIAEMLKIVKTPPCLGISVCGGGCEDCPSNRPEEHCIIWHDHEAERHAIKKALPEAVEVYGSQDLEVRENRIIGFSRGEFKFLATKPILSGSGCNFQRHCSKAVFLGIGFKFNDFIQAIHRIHRFLQERECHIHIIYTTAETRVLETLKRKWAQHDHMVEQMTEIIRKYGLSQKDMLQELTRSIGVERVVVRGSRFTAVNNDCVEETKRMPENSVGLIHTSIPFANHYEYTPSYNDFGHTDDNTHFWDQMDYLTPELLRVLAPGRIYACHVKDRVLFGNVTGKGAPTISPFHAECIFHGQKHGFDYLGMITVVTDVVRENNQTYRLGWSEQCKDGTKMGVGSPEYIILFRKPQTDRSKGYADEPVSKDKAEYSRARWQVDAHAMWRSSGNRLMTPEELGKLAPDTLHRVFDEFSLSTVYDHEEHVRIGESLDLKGSLPATFMCLAPASHHPEVWHDINRMHTLNGNQSQRGLQQHVCPLQFDIVDRIVRRYSNQGDLVMDPFAGLMTVPYRALMLGRRGYGIELNHDYYLDGVNYLRAAEQDLNAPSLFDLLTEKEECTAS